MSEINNFKKKEENIKNEEEKTKINKIENIITIIKGPKEKRI